MLTDYKNIYCNINSPQKKLKKRPSRSVHLVLKGKNGNLNSHETALFSVKQPIIVIIVRNT